MNESEKPAYMMSFLAILVERAGGSLMIEHLSEYAGMYGGLEMKIDQENDNVLLTSKFVQAAPPSNHGRIL